LLSCRTHQFQVALIDMPNSFGFRRTNDQTPLANVVAERWHASHPHALALGGGDFVPDALARYLPLGGLGTGTPATSRVPTRA
jgi:hypothetical protein